MNPIFELEILREIGVASGVGVIIIVFLRTFVHENIQQNKAFTDNLMHTNASLMEVNKKMLENNERMQAVIQEQTNAIKLLSEEIRRNFK